MRIDGLQLREGSYITNMSIAAGSAFPNSPNTGELFYRTDSENVGLHVYDSSNTSWNKCFTSGDVALSLPANTTPGTYKSVTVNNQGIVSAGTNPTTLAGYGIVDAQALDADLTAIAALAGTSGLLKKTAADTWTLDTNTYLTSNQTITLTGGVTGSGTGTFAVAVVTNANLTGPVTSVGNATAIANGAITNAMLANGAVANLSGTNTGDQTSVSGNAGTATALQTARTIAGTSFDGTANIDITYANLTGLPTLGTAAAKNIPATGDASATEVVYGTDTRLTNARVASGGNAATVTNGVYTTDTGTVTNIMLAGSIANAKLLNSSVTVGSTSIALGATSTTLAGLTSVTSTQFVGALNGTVGVITPATGSFTIVNATGSIISNSNIAISNGGAIAEMYFNSGITKIESNATGSSIAIVPSNTIVGVFSTSGLAVTGTITGTSFNSITGLSSTLPAAPGSATIGVSTTAARSDHVHALQTSVSGSAATLATGRTFSLSTDATGTSAAFDGSANVTIPMTLATVNSNVGSFGSATQVASITLDAKGRATAASNVSIAIPTSAVTSGTFADARIATSNITQHQASLTIAETQITDGTLLARNAGNETISGNWTFSNVVTGVTPSAASHLTTKAYVDGLATGLDTKASCRAATTANITLSGTQTIDGVAVIAGNRVLVKDQSTATQNGIYDVAAGAWVRSADADNLPGTEVTAGMYTFISEGTVNADTGWTLSTNDTVVLGTTPLTFTQFTGLGQISAGAGLTKTGSVIDIGTASASRIVINTDNIDLATAGTAGTYRSVTTDAYGRVISGTNPTTLAGYGITDAVTSVSVVTANGVSGSVTATTTPAITLTLGAITPTSVTATGQIAAGNATGFYLNQVGTRSWNITATGGNLNINSGDGDGTVSTNANLYFNGTLSGGVTAGGRLFYTDGSVIKTKISSSDAAWASMTMYEAASSTLSLGAFGAYGTTKDTAAYSYVAAQGQDYNNASLKVTPTQVLITGTLRAGDTYYGVTAIERTVPYVNGIKIKTTIEWANNSFFELHIHGYHYRQGTTVDLRICAYAYSTGGAPINYSATSAGGWAPTITLVNESGFISIVLGVNKQDGYFLQCSVDLTSQVVPNLTGWTVVDETGTGLSVQYKSDFGYATVNNLGMQVLGGVALTTSDALGGLVVSGAAQSSIFNNTIGTYSTWQHNSTSVGDIGTGNQVISGGSSADFGVTSRAGKLVLGTGSIARATIDTSGNLGLGVTPSAWNGFKAFEFGAGNALMSGSSGFSQLYLLNNAYYNGSAYIYKNTQAAAMYQHNQGAHSWHTAPSGTAGNAITFTQAMTLNASGNLGLGAVPSAFFLDAGPALQINKFSIQQTGGFDVTALTTNGYQSSSGVMKYIGTASATRYRHANGAHYWDKAPSGTADTVIAFTQQMILDVNSNLAVTGSVNTATGLNITGYGGFFNGANKFGIDHISGTSRFYSSGPNTTTRGTFEFHPTSSDGTLDFIAMKVFSDGRLHLTQSSANQVLQSFTGVGGTNAYVDFAAVEIGGQTSNGAWLRWTRDGSQARDFSIHTTDTAATSFKTLTATSTGIQINGTVTTTGGVDKLKTASGAVSVAAATAPTTGQVLTATSATTATWQASSTVAAAGTLTGTTLAANVVNSSLTSLGTLTSPLSVNAVTQDTMTTAVTTTSATVVDSVSSSAFRTAKYIVQVTDSTNSQYHAVEILVIHDGTTVYKTEYGEITTAASLGTFDAAIVTGTLRLSFTAVAATTKSVKVYRAAITA